jgi:hypothetical protein
MRRIGSVISFFGLINLEFLSIQSNNKFICQVLVPESKKVEEFKPETESFYLDEKNEVP